MDREEIHHKMSKKIAQLTKVIFHLNTRNEESDAHLQAVVDAYEQEIESILNDANAKVRKAIKSAEKAQGDNVAQKVEALQKQFEDEKKTAMRELQDFKGKMGDREARNAATWTEKVKAMNTEIASLREKCSDQALKFKAALQAAERGYSEKTAALVSTHKGELQQLGASHMEALQAQLREREASEAQLRAASDAQLAEASQRRQALEAELTEARRLLGESRASGGDALRQAHEERERLSAELAEARGEIERLRRYIDDQTVALQQRDQELADLRESLRELEERRGALDGDADDLRKQLDAMSAKAKAVKAERDGLEQKLRQTERDGETRDAEAAKQRAVLEARVKVLEQSEATLKIDLVAKTAAEDHLRKSEAQLKERVAALEAEAEGLRAELASLRSNLANTSADLDTTARRLREELAALQASLEAERTASQRLREELELQKVQAETRLDDAKKKAQVDLEALKAAHAAALEALRKQHEDELAGKEQAHAAKLREQITQLEAQLEALRKSSAEQAAALEEQVAEKDAEVVSLRQKLDVAEKGLEEMIHKNCALMTERDDLVAQLARARQEAEDLQGEMQKLKGDHQEELKALRARFDGELAAAGEKHRQELEALRQAQSRLASEKDAEREAEIKRLKEELKSNEEKHTVQTTELQRRIDELLNQGASNGSKAKAELDALRAEMQRQIDEARGEAVQLVQKLSAEHQTKLTEVYAQQSQALTDLREKLQTSHQERVDEMRAKHKAEIEELKKKYEAQIADMSESHAKSVEDLKSQHTAAVEVMEKSAADAEVRHAASLEQSETALRKENELLAREKEQTSTLEATLQGSRDRIESLNNEIQSLLAAHTAALTRKDEDFAREKRNLKEQHKDDTERLLAEQLRAVEELKEQFDKARHLQDMQIDMLQKRLAELQELYDNRPSREEDLDLIARLQQENLGLTAQCDKLVEEMKFYKLELVNREQNYNKVFGSQPNVGVMNPLARKGSCSTEPKMRLVGGGGPGGGLPQLGGMGGLVAGPGPMQASGGSNGSRKLQKRPSSGSIRRTGAVVD